MGWYGGDETHARSAWCSTSTDLTAATRARVPRLLKFLARNNHGTPFEKSMLHFAIKTDLPSHIHTLRHRSGVSVNAESARYREIAHDDFYVPADWPAEMQARLARHSAEGMRLYHEACASLEGALGPKRAKETARYFRPMCGQIASDISFNFRSFAHFYRLRAAPDAQREIQDIAEQMLALVKAIPGNPFEHTLAAFGM